MLPTAERALCCIPWSHSREGYAVSTKAAAFDVAQAHAGAFYNGNTAT